MYFLKKKIKIPIIFNSKGFARRNPLHNQYEKEKMEFNVKMKEYRNLNRKIFWEEQSTIENEFLTNFNEEQRLNGIKLRANNRASIIKSAMICYDTMVNKINNNSLI